MKRFFSVLSLIMMMVFITPHAEAKKFGGGKSFGKSYKTAPAPKAQPTNTGTINKQGQSASSGKKGIMGGMLGGLLAGGLLAALFAGGAFEGFQFADFLIIGLIAFGIFMLIRMMKAKDQPRTAFASAGPNQQFYRKPQAQPSQHYQSAGASSTSSAYSDVPFNYPPNFNMQAFVDGACGHYRVIQQAWNKNELGKIQEYVSIEMYNELARERAQLAGEQHTEVMYVNAQVVRADTNNERAELSLKFSGRYRDVKEGVEEEIKDIWHLERSLTKPNAPWLIVGIE